MDGSACFSPDYPAARERFLQAAARLRLPVTSHPVAAKGPGGSPLFIDVATLGPADARQVIILSSGLHGIEGFFGSAVQLAWLERLYRSVGCVDVVRNMPLAANVKVVLVHGLNPFGFAWLRRWNENNVDLNRNFLADWNYAAATRRAESQRVYDRVANFLNPQRPPWPWEPYAARAVWRILKEGWMARRHVPADRRPSAFSLKAMKELGLAEMQKTLPVGQYLHRTGIFYGGHEPEETTRWLTATLPTWTQGAERTLHFDFHTGLGPWADCKLLLVDQKGSPAAQWAAEQFGEQVVEPLDTGKTAYNATGTIGRYFRDSHPAGRYQCYCVEFGTYPGSKILGALRAENQAHHFTTPNDRSYHWAKRWAMEAFVPASPAWRNSVVNRGLEVVDRGLEIARAARAALAA